MGTYYILTDVIFVQSGTYQWKSAMCKSVFSYSKTGLPPVWLDSQNYSSTFYLITLVEEIEFGGKYGEQKKKLKKIIIWGIERCQ